MIKLSSKNCGGFTTEKEFNVMSFLKAHQFLELVKYNQLVTLFLPIGSLYIKFLESHR